MLHRSRLAWRRGFREGVRGLLRESGWGTSLGVLVGMLLVCQLFVLVLAGLEGGIRLLEENMDLRLEVRESASDVGIQDFIQNVRSLPFVKDVVYITREQALLRMQESDPELTAFLSTFGVENPFPETIGVRLRHLSDYSSFKTFLSDPSFSSVVDPAFLSSVTDQEREVFSLIDATASIRRLALLVIGLLAVVLLFAIIEFVRKRALLKDDALFIEQLVGADPTTMVLPFFVEVLILLLLAIVLSLMLAGGIVLLVPFVVPALGVSGIFGPWAAHARSALAQSLPWWVLLECVGALLLALIGSLLALRRLRSFSLLSS